MKKFAAQINSTVHVLGEIFRRPRYIAIAVLGALAMLSFAAWFPNFGLVGTILMSEKFSVAEKISFVFNSYSNLMTSFSAMGSTLTIATAVLLGVNVGMMVYYLSESRGRMKLADGKMTFAGTIGGMLGVGCASCGSLILSMVGLSGAIALFPLRGLEFSIAAVLLLIASMAYTAKRIHSVGICAVPVKSSKTTL